MPVLIETSTQRAISLLDEFAKDIASAQNYWNVKPSDSPSGQAILNADPTIQIEVVKEYTKSYFGRWRDNWGIAIICNDIVTQLCKRRLPYSREDIQCLLQNLSLGENIYQIPFQTFLRSIQKALVTPEIKIACQPQLMQLKKVIYSWHDSADKRKLLVVLEEMLEDSADEFIIALDDWGTQANEALEHLEPSIKKSWVSLLRHAQIAEGSKPSKKWLEQAQKRIEALGVEQFQTLALEWIGFLSRFTSGAREETQQHTYTINQIYTYTLRYPYAVLNDTNVNIIKGLIWSCSVTQVNEDLLRMLAKATEWSLKKVIGVGPRAPRIANAAVYVLGQSNTSSAISQLARLKTRITFKTALKEIEKALDIAAKKAGVSKADLEEMGVPGFGLDEEGVRRESLGDITGELRVVGSDVTLTWFDAKGKILKNPPASVKKDFAEELKNLKATQKDISGMLSSLSAKLDNMFLKQKTWSFKTWRERYLEHPLVGTIARRLIWTIDDKPVTELENELVNAQDQEFEFTNDATVRLWHPIEASVDEVVAWREWFEHHGITQPFKQAHREVYILTEAEIRTGVYSNRFAAHILKQHQFNALCALRGWKNKLRLMVDDSYPPASLELPQWNFRAEFWIEGAGTNYGTDTNETGTYLYLSTDQVRFYQMNAPENSAHAGGGGYEMWLRNGNGRVQPIALDQIPALVFSEVMRDVDMFVGVCSVGNDATWQDGGPQGRYREYWTSYSFGELNATAETRKSLLAKLIPRLKIASRCKLEGRFLFVRGDMRSYKIHLGSSNILMEPNDQYLCIVPSQSTDTQSGKVFLPFEGDRMLSVILSKAFLLAEDAKIKDFTITRQIRDNNWN